MCFNCCVICTPNPSRGYQCFSLLYLFTCLSQGLTFLFLQSNACNDNPVYNLQLPASDTTSTICSLGWGAKTSIAATALWFVTAVMMCCVGFMESKDAAGSDENEDAAKEDVEEQAPVQEQAADDE